MKFDQQVIAERWLASENPCRDRRRSLRTRRSIKLGSREKLRSSALRSQLFSYYRRWPIPARNFARIAVGERFVATSKIHAQTVSGPNYDVSMKTRVMAMAWHCSSWTSLPPYTCLTDFQNWNKRSVGFRRVLCNQTVLPLNESMIYCTLLQLTETVYMSSEISHSDKVSRSRQYQNRFFPSLQESDMLIQFFLEVTEPFIRLVHVPFFRNSWQNTVLEGSPLL